MSVVIWPVTEETKARIKAKREKERLKIESELSENATEVLSYIRSHPKTDSASISEATGMAPRSVTGTVNSLVKKGLVKKNDDKTLEPVY